MNLSYKCLILYFQLQIDFASDKIIKLECCLLLLARSMLFIFFSSFSVDNSIYLIQKQLPLAFLVYLIGRLIHHSWVSYLPPKHGKIFVHFKSFKHEVAQSNAFLIFVLENKRIMYSSPHLALAVGTLCLAFRRGKG